MMRSTSFDSFLVPTQKFPRTSQNAVLPDHIMINRNIVTKLRIQGYTIKVSPVLVSEPYMSLHWSGTNINHYPEIYKNAMLEDGSASPPFPENRRITRDTENSVFIIELNALELREKESTTDAFLRCEISGNKLLIPDSAVINTKRRKGIGSLLFLITQDLARDMSLTLEVHVTDRSKDFYEKYLQLIALENFWYQQPFLDIKHYKPSPCLKKLDGYSIDDNTRTPFRLRLEGVHRDVHH